MGSKGGPRAVEAPYSGTQTSNQSSTNNFSSTSNSTVPEWATQAGQDLLGRGTNFLDQWSVNPLLQQGGQTASQIGAYGPHAFGTADYLLNQDRGGGYASNAIEELMKYAGMSGGGQFSGTGGGGRPDSIDRGAVRDVAWKDFTDYDIDQYMNPYTQNVIDASVGDVQRAGDVARLQRASQAAKAGALGGSRHGVLDAIAAGEQNREIGNLSSRLRAAGFDTAANLIGRDQAGGFGAQQANQGADLGVAQINAQLADSAANRGLQGRIAGENQRLQALQSALGGGINLAGSDTNRANSYTNLGTNAQQLLSQFGFGMQDVNNTPFDMITGLGSLLSGLPMDRSTTNSGTASGTSTGSGTSRGTGTQVVNTPNQASSNVGLGLMLLSIL